MKWTGGIPKWKHNRIHESLIKKFGKASKCEGESCTNPNPKRYEWALKKGHQYSKSKDDYLELCPSCHRKYDFNEVIRKKLQDRKQGQSNNRSKLTTSNVISIYKSIESGKTNKEIAKKHGVHPSTIYDIKRGKRWPKLFNQYNSIK